MNASMLRPMCRVKEKFLYSSVGDIPRSPGCYVLTTWSDDILYIGQSTSLWSRITSHLADPEKTSLTPAGKAFWFHYDLFDAFVLNRVERGWIQQHEDCEGSLPILNRIQPPSV